MLSLHNLSKRYPNGVIALAPTSLSIEAGKFTVLLGPSGAGKSTLLRCLNLLETPSTGRVESTTIGPLDVPQRVRAHRRRTGMIFQQHQLLPRLSVLHNVLLGRIGYHSFWRMLLPLGAAEQALALDALDRVGLADKAGVQARHLSGGQQQRVGIARALVQEPDLILADEPVASLDPASAERVLQLLADICHERRIAVVASLHQVELARRHADRIIGLAHGRVLVDASPADLDSTSIERIYTGYAPSHITAAQHALAAA